MTADEAAIRPLDQKMTYYHFLPVWIADLLYLFGTVFIVLMVGLPIVFFIDWLF